MSRALVSPWHAQMTIPAPSSSPAFHLSSSISPILNLHGKLRPLTQQRISSYKSVVASYGFKLDIKRWFQDIIMWMDKQSFHLRLTRSSGIHRMGLKVRDSDLDQYGVVNNDVYASYCQHVHHELIKKIDVLDEIAQAGGTLALTELTLKFLTPLRMKPLPVEEMEGKRGDRFIITVRASDYSAPRLYLEHLIWKLPNRERVMEATATAVWLNKNYQPVCTLEDEVRLKLLLLGQGLIARVCEMGIESLIRPPS